MATDKKYYIGVSAETDTEDIKFYDSYHEAEDALEKAKEYIAAHLKVFKVVITTTEATRSTEDYWEYR